MMNRAEIVEAMLDVLDSPEHWCKFILSEPGPDGERFCLMGALNKVMYGYSYGYHGVAITPATYKEGKQVIHVMDEIAIEKGYCSEWGPGPTASTIGRGAHAVQFNNAPGTEYEDVRLFLKETLERVAA